MSLESLVPAVANAAPAQLIKVVYPSGAEVNAGNELTPLATKNQPTTVEYPADAGSLYTLALVDLDSPFAYTPEDRGIRNWLVVNIPGSALESGETISSYFGPLPRQQTGLHRLVFIVYKQRTSLALDKPAEDNPEARLGFKVKEFASKHSLGEPVAANYFLAQYDDYAGQIRAQYSLTQK